MVVSAFTFGSCVTRIGYDQAMGVKIELRNGVCCFPVKVVPGASRERVVGLLGDALKVAVSSAPEGGKANQAVVELLARELGLAKSSITIVRGHTNPRKEVSISGIDHSSLEQKLLSCIR
jgi:uncharacterized protein